MDRKSCEYIIRTEKYYQKEYKSIYYHSVKTIIESISILASKLKNSKILLTHTIDELKEWIVTLSYLQISTFDWDFNSFGMIILIAYSLNTLVDIQFDTQSVNILLTVLKETSIIKAINSYIPKYYTVNRNYTPLDYCALTHFSTILELSFVCQQAILSFLIRETQKLLLISELNLLFTNTNILFLETFYYVINSMSQNGTEGCRAVAKQMTGYCIDLIKHLSLISIPSNQALVTTWIRAFSYRLSECVVMFLKMEPTCPTGIQSISDAFQLLQTPKADIQLIALSYILSSLNISLTTISSQPGPPQLRKTASASSKLIDNKKSTNKLVNAKNKIVKSLQVIETFKPKSIPDAAMNMCVDICKNGELRLVAWCLLHKRRSIRQTALQIIQLVFDTLASKDTILIGGIIEQGIVVFLEFISRGLIIAEKKSLSGKQHPHISFPESYIRSSIADLILKCGERLHASKEIKERICLALVHSRSDKLRGNIFSSLLLLQSIVPSLSRIIVFDTLDVATSSKSTDVVSSLQQDAFRYLMRELLGDDNYKCFQRIVTILLFILNQAQVLKSRDHCQQAIQTKLSLTEHKEKLQSGKSVSVLDNYGNYVKMQCPRDKIIASHHEILARQIGESTESDVLAGGYEPWQEIFSHMVDDFMISSNLKSLRDELLMKMYCTTCLYEITSLRNIYEQEIARRLSAANLTEFLRCGTGKMESVSWFRSMFHHQKIHAIPLQRHTIPASLVICNRVLTVLKDRNSKLPVANELANSQFLELLVECCKLCLHSPVG